MKRILSSPDLMSSRNNDNVATTSSRDQDQLRSTGHIRLPVAAVGEGTRTGTIKNKNSNPVKNSGKNEAEHEANNNEATTSPAHHNKVRWPAAIHENMLQKVKQNGMFQKMATNRDDKTSNANAPSDSEGQAASSRPSVFPLNKKIQSYRTNRNQQHQNNNTKQLKNSSSDGCVDGGDNTVRSFDEEDNDLVQTNEHHYPLTANSTSSTVVTSSLSPSANSNHVDRPPASSESSPAANLETTATNDPSRDTIYGGSYPPPRQKPADKSSTKTSPSPTIANPGRRFLGGGGAAANNNTGTVASKAKTKIEQGINKLRNGMENMTKEFTKKFPPNNENNSNQTGSNNLSSHNLHQNENDAKSGGEVAQHNHDNDASQTTTSDNTTEDPRTMDENTNTAQSPDPSAAATTPPPRRRMLRRKNNNSNNNIINRIRTPPNTTTVPSTSTPFATMTNVATPMTPSTNVKQLQHSNNINDNGNSSAAQPAVVRDNPQNPEQEQTPEQDHNDPRHKDNPKLMHSQTTVRTSNKDHHHAEESVAVPMRSPGATKAPYSGQNISSANSILQASFLSRLLFHIWWIAILIGITPHGILFLQQHSPAYTHLLPSFLSRFSRSACPKKDDGGDLDDDSLCSTTSNEWVQHPLQSSLLSPRETRRSIDINWVLSFDHFWFCWWCFVCYLSGHVISIPRIILLLSHMLKLLCFNARTKSLDCNQPPIPTASRSRSIKIPKSGTQPRKAQGDSDKYKYKWRNRKGRRMAAARRGQWNGGVFRPSPRQRPRWRRYEPREQETHQPQQRTPIRWLQEKARKTSSRRFNMRGEQDQDDPDEDNRVVGQQPRRHLRIRRRNGRMTTSTNDDKSESNSRHTDATRDTQLSSPIPSESYEEDEAFDEDEHPDGSSSEEDTNDQWWDIGDWLPFSWYTQNRQGDRDRDEEEQEELESDDVFYDGDGNDNDDDHYRDEKDDDDDNIVAPKWLQRLDPTRLQKFRESPLMQQLLSNKKLHRRRADKDQCRSDQQPDDEGQRPCEGQNEQPPSSGGAMNLGRFGPSPPADSFQNDVKFEYTIRPVFEVIGMDIFLTDTAVFDVSQHPWFLTNGLRDVPCFIANVVTQWGNILVYFQLPEWVKNFTDSLEEQSDDSDDIRALKRFLSGTDDYRNERLKMIPSIVDGPMAVKVLAPPKRERVIHGSVVPLSWYKHDAETSCTTGKTLQPIVVCAVDCVSSRAIRSMAGIVKKYFVKLSLDLALVVGAPEGEGRTTKQQDDGEEPQTCLGLFRFEHIDVQSCPEFPELEQAPEEEEQNDIELACSLTGVSEEELQSLK